MNNGRQSRLEQIRQESLDLYYSAKVNEARIQIGDRANGLGITGLGGGGSSASDSTEGPVHNVWVTFTDGAGDYKYTQYTFETDLWSETIDLGINTNDVSYFNFALTSGYGTGFNAEMSNGDIIFMYVDKNGELIWSNNYGTIGDWDIDGEETEGLVSFFAENGSDLEITIFYKDIKQTFTFDNVGPNGTSHNIGNIVVDNKVYHNFGNPQDGNVALWALDVVTGAKTIIYEPISGVETDLDIYYYSKKSATSNLDDSYNLLIVIEYDYNNGDIEGLRMIDYSGNVIHDIAAEAEGLITGGITGDQLTSFNQWGPYYESDDIGNCYFVVRTQASNIALPPTVVYGGYTSGAVYAETLLPNPFYGPFPYSQYDSPIDALVYYNVSSSGAVDVGSMTFGIAGPDDVELTVVRDDGTEYNYTLNSISQIVQSGKFLSFFTVTSDAKLKLCTIDLTTGASTFTLINGDYFDPAYTSNDYFSIYPTLDSGGGYSLYANVFCEDETNAFIFRALPGGSVYTIYNVNTGSSGNLGLYGYTSPVIIADLTDDTAWRINQEDNTTTQITNSLSASFSAGTDYGSWDTTYQTRLVYNYSGENVYIVTADSIVTLDTNHTSDANSTNALHSNTDVLVKHDMLDGSYWFFSFDLQGNLLNTFHLTQPITNNSEWYGSGYFVKEGNAGVIKDNGVSLKSIGTLHEIVINDQWWY